MSLRKMQLKRKLQGKSDIKSYRSFQNVYLVVFEDNSSWENYCLKLYLSLYTSTKSQIK